MWTSYQLNDQSVKYFCDSYCWSWDTGADGWGFPGDHWQLQVWAHQWQHRWLTPHWTLEYTDRYMISLISNLYTIIVSDVMLMGCWSVTWEAVSEMCMFTWREVDLPLLTSSSRIRTRASSVVAVTPLAILDSLVYIALKWVWKWVKLSCSGQPAS